MKAIFDIFKQDLTKVLKNKVATIILAGMLFIPGIYAWLNIDSNWNPYDNTGNIKIAVVNKDEGVSILKNDINIGDSLVQNLKSNDAMDWTFTDEADARTKVESGEYYGAIFLPENFSNKITSLFDGVEIEKPEFDFIVNDKKNPIAPIIVNKAIGTLETTLDQAFVNTIVYKVADKAEDLEVSERGTETINGAINRLNTAKQNIGNLRTTLNVVSSAANSTSSALSAVKDLLPTISSTLYNGTTTTIDDAKQAINSFGDINTRVDKDIKAIFESAEKLSSTNEDIVKALSVGDAKLNEKIEKSISILESLSNILNREQEIINTIQTLTGKNVLSHLQEHTSEAISKVTELKSLLKNIAEGGTIVLDQAKNKSSELTSRLHEDSIHYQEVVSPKVQSALENATNTLNSLANAVTLLDGGFVKTNAALSNTIEALNSATGMNANIDLLLGNLEKSIDKIINTLGHAEESDLYLKMINLLQNTPEDIADFISKPITTNKTELYHIDSYGSKMAPFYTILAAWVGCTLLVTIIKTDLEENRKNAKLKPSEAFFGRFLLFGTMSALQGLVIGLGDILLGVQVINIPLFLLTIMLSSLVFMLIIYSLTISFGKVGEAIAVVMMVIQVAGSGGTFPIELLPDFFQKLQPFMPFYPSTNALRETIGGFYNTTYLTFIIILLCHTIIPLILGLVIRKPIINLKKHYSKEIESTGVLA